MKDYYQILGVTPSSGAEEIRKRYRQLAMAFHPDRNPDNAQAEAKFKEIAEAYGVLTDPVKRRQYDTARSRGHDFHRASPKPDFNYSQEDILRDLFANPQFHQLFKSLLGDFQRSGFRANPLFLKQTFFGGRGGFLVGGLFFFGSLLGPLLRHSVPAKNNKKGLLYQFGQAVASLRPGAAVTKSPTSTDALDIIYHLGLSAEELQQGKWVQVAVAHDQQAPQILRVKIPGGSAVGQKLRVRGKGRSDGRGRQGDLYLQLEGMC